MNKFFEFAKKTFNDVNKDAKENMLGFSIKVIVILVLLFSTFGNIGSLIILSAIFFGYYLTNELYSDFEDPDFEDPDFEDPGIKENNQYLNFDVYDIGEEFPPDAYNTEPEKMNNNMELKTHVDTFLDASSVFEKKNAQRQFHTITHNKYDNREKFVNWVCTPDQSCKTDQRKCVKWPDDIRGPLYY